MKITATFFVLSLGIAVACAASMSFKANMAAPKANPKTFEDVKAEVKNNIALKGMYPHMQNADFNSESHDVIPKDPQELHKCVHQTCEKGKKFLSNTYAHCIYIANILICMMLVQSMYINTTQQ